jgi:hypothetical protein
MRQASGIEAASGSKKDPPTLSARFSTSVVLIDLSLSMPGNCSALQDIRSPGPQFDRKRCSATLGRSASGWVVGLPIPWHQLVDAFLRPAVDEACQQIRKIGLRIDLIQFAGLNQ